MTEKAEIGSSMYTPSKPKTVFEGVFTCIPDPQDTNFLTLCNEDEKDWICDFPLTWPSSVKEGKKYIVKILEV